jgi:hypothetical protein
MQDEAEHTNSSPKKRYSSLANISIILGVLGFVLPCLAFFILGFQLNDYFIDKLGLHGFNMLNVCVPMVLWIVGPIAIMVGSLSLRNHSSANPPEVWKNKAIIGIALGILTIPCVLLPLILWLLLAYACRYGC